MAETLRSPSDGGTYKLGNTIGKGGHGIVFQAWHLETGAFVAIKRMSLERLQGDSLNCIETEIELLKKLNHQHIVKYIDTIRTVDYLHIALEFMESGSLSQVLKRYGVFSEHTTAIYSIQILQGLGYLHEQGVLHRDIKAANILISKDGRIKLADFGVAMKLGQSKTSEESQSQSETFDAVGSPYWMAPEIIEMSAPPTSACDIWSVACTVVELVTGAPPYLDLSPVSALFRIVTDDYPPLPGLISEACRDFLLQCFKKEPLLRASAYELLSHPWIGNPANLSRRAPHQPRTSIDRIKSAYVMEATSVPKTKVAEEAILGGDEDWESESFAFKKVAPREEAILSGDEHWESEEAVPGLKKLSGLSGLAGGQDAADAGRDAMLSKWSEIDEGGADMSLNLSSAPETERYTQDDDGLVMVPGKLADRLRTTLIRGRSASPLSCDAGSPSFFYIDRQSSASEDPFNEDAQDVLYMPFDERDFLQHSDLDKLQRQSTEMLSLIAQLRREADTVNTETPPDDKLLTSLLDMFTASPEQRRYFIQQHGVIPIMDLLELDEDKALPVVLKVLVQIVDDDPKVLAHLSMLGVIPIIVKLAEKPGIIMTNATKIIDRICQHSNLTLKMFIGCGGLRLLVYLLSTCTEVRVKDQHRKVATMTVDAILKVVSLNKTEHSSFRGTIPRNDFCRLFSKLGLVPHLMQLFHQFIDMYDIAVDRQGLLKPIGTSLWGPIEKITDILTTISRSDPAVKDHMAQEGVLEGVLRVISPKCRDLLDRPKHAKLVLNLLKCIRNISMHPNTLDYIERSGAILDLVKLLDRRRNSPFDKDMGSMVLQCMFYLCRVSRRRQDQAAQSGLIPHLKRCIMANNPLKQFALPIICDLAHTSWTAREELKKNEGVKFYVMLLTEQFWQISALNSLAVWLREDVKHVEDHLVNRTNITCLVNLFCNVEQQNFENVLDPIVDMMAKSSKLAKALGGSDHFLKETARRLRSRRAIVRKRLLQMLQTLPPSAVAKHGLKPIIRDLSRDGTHVLVVEIALQLLADISTYPWPLNVCRCDGAADDSDLAPPPPPAAAAAAVTQEF